MGSAFLVVSSQSINHLAAAWYLPTITGLFVLIPHSFILFSLLSSSKLNDDVKEILFEVYDAASDQFLGFCTISIDEVKKNPSLKQEIQLEALGPLIVSGTLTVEVSVAMVDCYFGSHGERVIYLFVLFYCTQFNWLISLIIISPSSPPPQGFVHWTWIKECGGTGEWHILARWSSSHSKSLIIFTLSAWKFHLIILIASPSTVIITSRFARAAI